MRNLTQYPITDDEIERALIWASSRAMAEQGFGGIFGAALTTAKQHVGLLPELVDALEEIERLTEGNATNSRLDRDQKRNAAHQRTRSILLRVRGQGK